MTLVVARVTPMGVRLASDMRVTDPDAAGPTGYLGAALKLVLLRPSLCIGYAGNIGAALGAIREANSEQLAAEDAERRLLEAHARSEPKADFLVASLRPTRLVVVRDGRAEDVAAAWIGDQGAFAEYQFHYHQDPSQPPPEFYDSRERAEDIEIASRIGNGMGAVVHGPSRVKNGNTVTVTIPEGGTHKRVGEAIVNVVPRVEDNLFRYSPAVQWRESPFDPGAMGAFSLSALTPTEPGVGVIGLYFYEPRLGVLYAPLLLDEPERHSGMSRDAFVEMVRLRHGITLEGPGLVGAQPGRDREHLQPRDGG